MKQLTIEDMQTIDSIIENFDFAKTRKAMVALNWTWRGADESPSLSELESNARYLLNEVIRREKTNISTGGFTAYRIPEDGKKTTYSLAFNVSYSSVHA